MIGWLLMISISENKIIEKNRSKEVESKVTYLILAL